MGKPEWTVLSSGNTVPPVLNPALVFLRCHVVTDKRSTYAAVLQEFAVAAQAYIRDGNLESIVLIDEALARVCPPGDNSTNCPEIRTAFTEVAKLMAGKGQLRTAGETGAALKAEGDALICAHGWGQPAGGKCP